MILEEFLPLGAQVTFSVSTKGFKVHTKTKTMGCAIVCVELISNLFRTPYERNLDYGPIMASAIGLSWF